MVVSAAPPAAAASPSLGAAYAWCLEFAKAHQENFTVISWLLPRDLRPHFAAVYAFCRMTDDLGDEAEGDRLALLDAWEAEFRASAERPAGRPVLAALRHTMAAYRIPDELFLRLIEANRIDQRKRRFATFAELLDYCSYSATPVGRMVLALLGYHDEERGRLADDICIGLQLANFWQDVSRDLEKGRVYIPLEDLASFGVREEDILARRVTGSFRLLMRFEVQRTREYFRRGAALERLVDRRVRLDVRLFRLGGEAVLDAITARCYDTLSGRPAISRRRKAWLAAREGIRLLVAG
jgi:squalene synthase HpnC